MKLHFFFNRFFLMFLFSSIFFLLSTSTQAQSKNGIFLEAGGAVSYYSLNYNRQLFSSEKTKTYVRVGGSIWESGVAFPVGISLLFGSGDHHPTISLIATPHSQGTRFWSREDSDILLDLVAGFEYRYQPAGKSFFVNAGLYPYLSLDPTSSDLSEKEVEFRFRMGGGIGWFF
ncbi:MAG: hypothetical protein AB8H03_11200 [Saprospiraceae bacterium]